MIQVAGAVGVLRMRPPVGIGGHRAGIRFAGLRNAIDGILHRLSRMQHNQALPVVADRQRHLLCHHVLPHQIQHQQLRHFPDNQLSIHGVIGF